MSETPGDGYRQRPGCRRAAGWPQIREMHGRFRSSNRSVRPPSAPSLAAPSRIR